MGDKFKVIVADPPWAFNDKLTMSDVARGAAANYSTLDLDAIVALSARELAAEDAFLAIWCPSSMLVDGLRVMEAWGFSQKGVYTWVKTAGGASGLAFGMGRYFRGCTEHALFGVRGKATVGNKSQRNCELAPALPHSQKPPGLQDALEKMYPGGPWLELFARRDRPGWTCVGNECPSTPGVDIREWLARP